MKNLSKEIDILIKNELSLYTKKLNALLILEILKYKIIDKLKIDFDGLNPNSNDFINSNNYFEDEFRKIDYKISHNNTPSVKINSELKSD